MPAPLKVTPCTARRFQRRALLIDAPAPGVAAALAHHGYVQIDPINVCGRMHDLILRNRVLGYREGDLMRHVHGDGETLPAERRVAFEHHLPTAGILVAFPLEAWPHLLASMQARARRAGPWSGRLTAKEREFAAHLFAEITARGPLSSEDFTGHGPARRFFGGWGSATLAKSAMQKLFFHGRLLIARRESQRRIYDLPERLLPAATLAQPAPSASETARWEALLKLRQRRLVALKREELRHLGDEVQAVEVEGCPLLHCLRDDLPLFDAAPAAQERDGPRLLAPLDPLIYDRRVTAALWDFDYTWEVYTPPHKRVRGYYALPVLAATELVGHVDPKADREARRLTVVSRSVRRGHKAAPAVAELAKFLGLLTR